VNFERPLGVQAALGESMSGDHRRMRQGRKRACSVHAAQLIEAALSIAICRPSVGAADVDLLRTFAIVKTPPGSSFSLTARR